MTAATTPGRINSGAHRRIRADGVSHKTRSTSMTRIPARRFWGTPDASRFL
jgi:hypothetical protein